MSRRKATNGKVIIDELQDLRRGDEVCVSYWGGRYIKTTVTRVKTVECATIITVDKVGDIPTKRFVGYYTGKIAIGADRTILTLDTYWGTLIQEMLESADKRSEIVMTRAKALKAMIDLKTWLFTAEDEYKDRKPE